MPHIPDTLHERHDLELVAAYAAGDAEGPALEQAAALVASCTECAALHHDLRAIAAAMPELPAPARSRDFRLTPEQASSLRPTGIRGLLAAFSGPRFAFATPLGTGLAALGIVGVLVASGGFASGGASSAPQITPEAATGMITLEAQGREAASDAAASVEADAPAAGALASEAPAAAASPAPSAGVDTMGGGEPGEAAASAAPAASGPGAPEPSPTSDKYIANVAPSPPASAAPAAGLYPAPSAAPTTDVTSTLTTDAGQIEPALVVAVALLLAGIVLVALRWVARRTA